MAPSKRLGKDAVFLVLLRFIHPSKEVRDCFPNPQSSHRLHECKVLRLEAKIVNRKSALCVVFVHDNIKTNDEHVEMHVLPRWIKVEREGPSEFFFNAYSPADAAEEGDADKQETPTAAFRVVKNGRVTLEDLSELKAVVEVDDDNEPAPENVPSPTDSNVGVSFFEWGHSGVCNRRMLVGENVRARIKNFPPNVTPTALQLFELLFPKDYIQNVIIVETNKKLKAQMQYGEFFVWLGLWFLMSTTRTESRRDFWSNKNVDLFEGAPYRFGHIMSRTRFEEILTCITYTCSSPPAFKDRFWEVRDFIDAWNNNCDANFASAWINCLDESMSKWLSEFTCPGFIFCPRKPWPFGNEWHTIACGESGILFRVELVEGKDSPPERPAKQFSAKGKTVGLRLRLTAPLWGTSKVVVLDSGFCVLQGIVELRRKGIFSGALIKKRRYWPKHIRGDDIAQHFSDKEVGSVDSWPGKYDEVDFSIVCMKEPDYVLSIMTTYGTLNRLGTDKFRPDENKRVKKIRYPEVIHNHYTYRDAVDANNSARMDPIALEETWKTSRWPNRVFQFLIAISEVNTKLALERLYGGDSHSQQSFRKLLCKELINNPYLAKETPGKRRVSPRKPPSVHKLESMPKNRTFKNGQLVYCKTDYIQLVCHNCKNRARQYCACTPGMMLCNGCFIEHVSSPPNQLFPED